MFTRQHLIEWLDNNVTDRVLKNVLNGGKVEAYGWFDQLPYTETPGFIVALTSYRKKTYIVAVSFREVTADPYYFRIKDVPWSKWKGWNYPDELRRGDNPEKYRRIKDEKNPNAEK